MEMESTFNDDQHTNSIGQEPFVFDSQPQPQSVANRSGAFGAFAYPNLRVPLPVRPHPVSGTPLPPDEDFLAPSTAGHVPLAPPVAASMLGQNSGMPLPFFNLPPGPSAVPLPRAPINLNAEVPLNVNSSSSQQPAGPSSPAPECGPAPAPQGKVTKRKLKWLDWQVVVLIEVKRAEHLQLKNKWDSLSVEFKAIDDYMKASGSGNYFELGQAERKEASLPVNFQKDWFDLMHSFLSKKANVNPPYVAELFDPIPLSDDEPAGEHRAGLPAGNSEGSPGGGNSGGASPAGTENPDRVNHSEANSQANSGFPTIAEDHNLENDTGQDSGATQFMCSLEFL
ncbi:hypothetical protein R1sor_005718 [Riccia sorocarpa]|uniref:Myb-like domain-containing protein n=1 Tax=Riccia sorocarpa TaxID=122646 RepID=A0ABD3HNW5_9MARC